MYNKLNHNKNNDELSKFFNNNKSIEHNCKLDEQRKNSFLNFKIPYANVLLLSVFSISITSPALAQECLNTLSSDKPDSRYEIISDGQEVKDNKTGLIWQRCSIGQTWNGSECSGSPISYDWQNALIKAKEVGEGYRLPNIKELRSLVSLQCYNPAINTNIFPNTPNDTYWSSSPVHGNDQTAWNVGFGYGYDYDYYYKDYKAFVRAVR